MRVFEAGASGAIFDARLVPRLSEKKTKTVAGIALSVGLFLSAELGGNILSSDAFLWAASPGHAYGLMAFVGMDLVLIAALWDRIRYAGTLPIVKYAGTLSILLAAVQFLAMVGDLAGLQPPSGMTASAFRSYLLSDDLYVVLLLFQPVIVGLGIWFKRQIGALESRPMAV